MSTKTPFRIQNFDFPLLLFCCALTSIGIAAIYSADPSRARSQFYGMLIGIGIAVFLTFLDYHFFLRFFVFYYVLSIVLLVLVLLVGYSSHNAQRWLVIAGIRFQPAEATKILLILFYAEFIMIFKEKMKNLLFDLACLALILPPIYLVFKQPDLSTSIILAVIFFSLMFIGGVTGKLVAAVVAFAIPTVPILFYYAIQPDSPIIKGYQQKRILAWLHPEDYAMKEAYQTLNSLMAIGSGQLSGKGMNTNEISSVLSGGFISESQTDFIYTVIGEAFGFIGACAVILMILFISVDSFIIASRAKDLSGKIIATGMGAWIGFQGFLNIAIATGVLPNTGIPLPFVSSGLTSLLSTYVGIGFVLSVRMQTDRSMVVSVYRDVVDGR